MHYPFVVNVQIIGNVFRKSLRLSGRARAEHSIGQITTIISKDATHLDAMSAFGHQSVYYYYPDIWTHSQAACGRLQSKCVELRRNLCFTFSTSNAIIVSLLLELDCSLGM